MERLGTRMQFLMADRTVKTLPDVVTVEAQEGRLVCRDRWGAELTSFGHADVVAFADHFEFNEAFLSERRERHDSRDGRSRRPSV